MIVDPALITAALRAIHPDKLSAEDAETIMALAQMSVDADGQEDADEIKMFFTLGKCVNELAGISGAPTPTFYDDDDPYRIGTLAKQLLTPSAKELAYAVSHLLSIIDVQIQPDEEDFLERLRDALQLDDDRADELGSQLGAAITPPEE